MERRNAASSCKLRCEEGTKCGPCWQNAKKRRLSVWTPRSVWLNCVDRKHKGQAWFIRLVDDGTQSWGEEVDGKKRKDNEGGRPGEVGLKKKKPVWLWLKFANATHNKGSPHQPQDKKLQTAPGPRPGDGHVNSHVTFDHVIFVSRVGPISLSLSLFSCCWRNQDKRVLLDLVRFTEMTDGY